MTTAWDIEKEWGFPTLTKDVNTDVCIVGAGLAGVWNAYLLAQQGKRVVVLEKGKVGRGATFYTTAFLTQSIDTGLAEMESMFDAATAKAVWQAGSDAIDLVEKVIDEEHIDCEFKRESVFIYAESDKEFDELKEENNLAQKFGFSMELHTHENLGFKNSGALELKRQAKYHPIKFLYGLIEACEKLGVEFYEETEAVNIVGEGPVTVEVKNGKTVKADCSVTTTYQPFNNPKSVFAKKGMYVSYVYELSAPTGQLPEGMYIDMQNPYHYIRVDKLEGGKDRIIVGGEDHRKELQGVLEEKSFKALKEYIGEKYPDLDYTVSTRWAGDILEPADGLPLSGLGAPAQYLACAFSGSGMTFSPISAMVISDLILDKKNAWSKIYDPQRTLGLKSLSYKFKDYGAEFFGGAVKNLFT